MSDSAQAENVQMHLQVNGQYIKDFSFEAPHAPGIFAEMQAHQPEIPIHIDVGASDLGNDMYEVVLHLRVEAKLPEKPVFIVELAYGGLFTVKGSPEHRQLILLVECPRLLFPFARNIVADATRDGGFPPLMLQPIDFMGLLQQRVQAAEAEAAGRA